jgi:RNA polymerase sigma factor (sigma-70 family)
VPPTSVKEPAPPVFPATQYVERLSEDRVLLQRFHAGDQDAFADLYRRYHPRVLAVLRRELRDPHLAEDLAAETFTRALAALPGLRYTGRDLDSWLFRIARNLMADHFRRCETRRMTPVAQPEHEQHVADARGPEATAVDRTDLLDALRQLEPRHRAVVVHRVLLDLSIQDTAAALGWHISMVKHQLSRALLLLARLLRDSALVRAEVALA